jgi:hypothetical protein
MSSTCTAEPGSAPGSWYCADEHRELVVALLTDLDVAGSREGLAITQATSERWPRIRRFLRNTDIADIDPFIGQPDHV